MYGFSRLLKEDRLRNKLDTLITIHYIQGVNHYTFQVI